MAEPKPITFNGKTKCVRGWARDIGLSRSGLRERLLKGWPLQRALTVAPPTHCKLCGEELLPEEQKGGRPREYHFLCQKGRRNLRRRGGMKIV